METENMLDFSKVKKGDYIEFTDQDGKVKRGHIQMDHKGGYVVNTGGFFGKQYHVTETNFRRRLREVI